MKTPSLLLLPFFAGAALFAGCQTKTSESTSNESTSNSVSQTSAEQPTPEPQHSSTAPRVAPPKGFGNAQGRVLFNGQPAPNIEVMFCENINFISGCGGQTFKAKTDKDGNYTIDKVKPGEYGLAVRVFNTNGFVYPTSGILSASKFKIEEGQTLDIRATNLFKTDLAIVSPKSGETIQTGAPKLGWKAYPGAANYEISLSSKDGSGVSMNLKTAQTSIEPEKPLLNGEYQWKIEATNGEGVKIAETPQYATFKVVGQAGSSRVEIVAPTKDASVAGANLKFSWKKHPLADGYQIYLAPANSSTPVLSFEKVEATQYTLSQPLPAGKYFWSVNATKGGEKVAASELFPLTVK